VLESETVYKQEFFFRRAGREGGRVNDLFGPRPQGRDVKLQRKNTKIVGPSKKCFGVGGELARERAAKSQGGVAKNRPIQPEKNAGLGEVGTSEERVRVRGEMP